MKRFLAVALLAVSLLSLWPTEADAARRRGGPRRGRAIAVRAPRRAVVVAPRRGVAVVGVRRARFATVIDPVTGLFVRVRVR